MFRRCALRCALGLAVLLSGCRPSGVQGCLDLLSAQRYRTAVRQCAAVFAASGDPRAGAAVVVQGSNCSVDLCRSENYACPSLTCQPHSCF
ncbi:MAG TPA: hypothetical protein VGS07_21720 [Thermoanaerobaculia bacterium]|jgi:hypothetical protein|nr:hypothetical protein [Thermoanaerobaculia bacterium]